MRFHEDVPSSSPSFPCACICAYIYIYMCIYVCVCTFSVCMYRPDMLYLSTQRCVHKCISTTSPFRPRHKSQSLPVHVGLGEEDAPVCTTTWAASYLLWSFPGVVADIHTYRCTHIRVTVHAYRCVYICTDMCICIYIYIYMFSPLKDPPNLNSSDNEFGGSLEECPESSNHF